jgi:hypothetical protein
MIRIMKFSDEALVYVCICPMHDVVEPVTADARVNNRRAVTSLQALRTYHHAYVIQLKNVQCDF